ncbi:hypothetical protein [Mucilaginibacter terrigena]|uniref:hypothetical protein n=1 Tax=Mucilaginibacter terrigena TaxID=2492395 RepID=UPI001396BB0D|nr:hypothetical protein [Mucilaginibacter terrigena]
MALNIDPNILQRDDLAVKALDHETDLAKAKAERGWLGQFWGSATSIPNNVAALIASAAFFFRDDLYFLRIKYTKRQTWHFNKRFLGDNGANNNVDSWLSFWYQRKK